MGAARRLVLGGAILGLFWSGLPRYGAARAESGQSSKACNPPPCTCDDYGRLTCDCKGQEEDLILASEGENSLSPHTTRITVTDCPSLIIQNSSLATMNGLRSLELTNIGNLSLSSGSFRLSRGALRARISVRDATIFTMPSFAFHGDVESMSFENVTIERVSAFAFANLADTDTLRFDNCHIVTMEEQSFKKFNVNYLRINGGYLGAEIASRTMNDIEITTSFIIDGVVMGNVRSSAFVIKKPKTIAIQNCIIENIEAGAFDVTARGSVIIKNNNFATLATGAFLGITGDRDNRDYVSTGTTGRRTLPDINFTNNSLVNFEEGSIMFDRTSFRPFLEYIYVKHSCDCSMLDLWRNKALNYTNLYGKFYENVNERLTGTLENVETIEITDNTFLCYDDTAYNGTTRFVDYELKKCAIANSIMFLALMIVFIVFFVACAIILIFWCWKKRRDSGDEKRWTSVPSSAPDVIESKNKNGVIGREGSCRLTCNNATPVDSRITMVVPDGRLYRETEFHVIVEKAEPLTTEL